MINLSVNITEKEKSYPVVISICINAEIFYRDIASFIIFRGKVRLGRVIRMLCQYCILQKFNFHNKQSLKTISNVNMII